MFHVEHRKDRCLVRLNEDIIGLGRKLASFGLKLEVRQLAQLQLYYDLLILWTQKVNLVSKRDQSRLIDRHFLDCFSVLTGSLFGRGMRVLDLGSGAGFPGLLLKIARPDLTVVLVESKRKKCRFLNKVIGELGLEGAEVVCERVENLSDSFYGCFDVVVARAVAELAVLWDWGNVFLKSSGHLVAMKGGDLRNEIEMLQVKYRDLLIAEFCPGDNLVSSSLAKKIVVVSKDRRKMK